MKLAFKVFLLCFLAGASRPSRSPPTCTGVAAAVEHPRQCPEQLEHYAYRHDPSNEFCGRHQLLGQQEHGQPADNHLVRIILRTLSYDFNIGCTGATAAAGKVSQTSGTTTIDDDLNIGLGAISGNPISSFTMSGGSMIVATEIYVGQSNGYGSLTISGGTVTNGADPTVGGTGWTQIGRESGSGTLTMSGTGKLTCGEEFRAGWMGGTATVNMSGTSTITARPSRTWAATLAAS